MKYQRAMEEYASWASPQYRIGFDGLGLALENFPIVGMRNDGFWYHDRGGYLDYGEAAGYAERSGVYGHGADYYENRGILTSPNWNVLGLHWKNAELGYYKDGGEGYWRGYEEAILNGTVIQLKEYVKSANFVTIDADIFIEQSEANIIKATENLVSITISPEDQIKIDAAVTELVTVLKPLLISLTTAQRRDPPKMGDGTSPSVEKSLDYARSNPEFAPPYMNVAEMATDPEAVESLLAVYRPLH